MQWCLPLRRQHAGTLANCADKVSGANTPAHSVTSNELAISRLSMKSALVLVNHALRLVGNLDFGRVQHVPLRLGVDHDPITHF